jgi:hypothetical protein
VCEGTPEDKIIAEMFFLRIGHGLGFFYMNNSSSYRQLKYAKSYFFCPVELG